MSFDREEDLVLIDNSDRSSSPTGRFFIYTPLRAPRYPVCFLDLAEVLARAPVSDRHCIAPALCDCRFCVTLPLITK